MKIRELIPNELPKHTEIHNVRVSIRVNANSLDLQKIYESIHVSNDAIQIAKHQKNIKHSTEMSEHNKLKLRDYKRFGSLFTHLILNFENMHCMVLSGGLIKISFNLNCTKVDEYMSNFLALIGNPTVLQCNLIGVTFTIKIKDTDKDSLVNTLLKTSEVNIPTGFNKLLQYKKLFRFRIMNNIGGNARSFEALNEFVKFLGKYVEFDDNLVLTDDCVLNDDDIHLEVMI